jgi:hypothetical protein
MHPPDPASMIFCLSLNEAEAHEPRNARERIMDFGNLGLRVPRRGRAA